MDSNEDDENNQSKPYSIYDDTSTVHHKINPDCPVCLKPVFWSRHILSLDRVWHLQCFICSFCFKSLRPGEQSYYGGRLFCTAPCFNELFLGQCTTKNATSLGVNRASIDTDTTKAAKVKNVMDKPETTEDAIKNQEKTKNQKEAKDKKEAKNQKDEKIQKEEAKIEIKSPSEAKATIETKTDLKQSTCLHCKNFERLIINHHRHRLTDKYPHCKFPGYKENVELYQSRQRKLLENLDKNQLNHTTNLNRSVQSSDFIGQRCIRCLKEVYAAELCHSINFPLHFNCLRCSICDRILQPAAHAVHDGLPICNSPCYNRIYSFGGYRKGWQECKP